MENYFIEIKVLSVKLKFRSKLLNHAQYAAETVEFLRQYPEVDAHLYRDRNGKCRRVSESQLEKILDTVSPK